MPNKSIGFGRRGTLLLVYQFLAYCGYCAFTNFPQNVMSEYYGGTTVTTLMSLIGSLVGYVITYFIVAPRINKIKSVKRVGLIIGCISLVFCALICLVPPTNKVIWCVFFVCVLITTQLWGCFFATMLIGNWFPRRKGTVMGIVTMAFPIITGICLSLFFTHFYTKFGANMAIFQGDVAKAVVRANISAFSPYWIAAVVSIVICAIFLKDFPEQVGEFRDNDKSFTAEMAQQMMIAEVEARQKSVWKRSKIWGCKDWWLMSIPNSLLLSCAMAFMVQIIPVLNGYGEALDVLAFPGFILTSTGVNTVLFGLSIFACFGSWLLGVLDTKFGTKTAVLITSIIMLISGILGMLDSAVCAVAACWGLGLFMGASSNFGLSAIVRYWRAEDFPSVYSGAPPLGTIIGAVFPFLVASLAAKFTYSAAFLFVAIMAVVCIISISLFNPLGIAKYDNKLRVAAGMEADNALIDRYNAEKGKK